MAVGDATPAQGIKGYRQLTPFEVDQINTLKGLAHEVGRVVETMASSVHYDQRWVAIAKTDLQTGFMALVRAIARPEGF